MLTVPEPGDVVFINDRCVGTVVADLGVAGGSGRRWSLIATDDHPWGFEIWSNDVLTETGEKDADHGIRFQILPEEWKAHFVTDVNDVRNNFGLSWAMVTNGSGERFFVNRDGSGYPWWPGKITPDIRVPNFNLFEGGNDWGTPAYDLEVAQFVADSPEFPVL